MSAEQLALEGPGHIFAPAAVLTAHVGRNDAMIASVARLYIPDGATVIDVTWGKGRFWHRTDTSRFRLVGSDLDVSGAQLQADFRALPYRTSTADVVVLDPPYVHFPSQHRWVNSKYRNSETTHGVNQRGITGLYRDGMAEALRVLRPRGTCWVKCQDTVEGRQQQWSVVTMHAMALELGFAAQDLFVLVNPTPPGGLSAERQYHARRNHSYLWIFTKRSAP